MPLLALAVLGRLAGKLHQSFDDSHLLGRRHRQKMMVLVDVRAVCGLSLRINRHSASWRQIKESSIRVDGVQDTG